MPPLRTVPAAKPMKTERTHEENQERAYIAASRRSDRSLEARIESARRASEIHKRRTGRSLRVTEQDVINEEMYEEEDDDLPMQYRRLTAHLQTQNADFDRRLAAYLTNHVAMRSALGQAVSDAYQNNNYNNLGQFMNPGMMQMPAQQNFQNPMMPPQQPQRSPNNYRQSPYPTQNNPSMFPAQHGRSISIATAPDSSYQRQPSQSLHNSPVDVMKTEGRRMSLPPHSVPPQTPTLQSGMQQSRKTSPSSSVSRNGSFTNLAAGQTSSQTSPKQQPTPPGQSHQLHQSPQDTVLSPFQFNGYNNASFDPLSSNLPMESQQFLAGSAWDKGNDSWHHTMMPQMHQQVQSRPAQPQYSYNPNGKPRNKTSPITSGSMPQFPTAGTTGMNQTLAPCMLDGYKDSPISTTNDSGVSPYTPAGYFGNFNDQFSMDMLKEPSSGQVSPGEGDWRGMLTLDAWDDTVAA